MRKSVLPENFKHADATPASHINGREFTVNNVSGNSITINTTGLSFPDDSFTLTETDIYVMSDESESVEAFFEGASDVYEGAAVNFSSEKIVIREIGDANKHAYTNRNGNDWARILLQMDLLLHQYQTFSYGYGGYRNRCHI